MGPIPYGRQNITQADIEAVTRALKADFLTAGPMVAEFEKEFSAYVGAPHAVAVANGTAALHLSALALGVNPGDTVLTTPLTFAASANCVRYCGGEVIFADIDRSTYNLDPRKAREKIHAAKKAGKRVTGIVAVDFGGLPVDLVAMREVAEEFGLWILEDSCHALGASASSGGKKWTCGDGSMAELTVFSFHPVKHVASAEGGMISTRNPELHQKLQELRAHGIVRDPKRLSKMDGPWYHEMQELGFNYRMPDLLCALGISQLRQAPPWLERRRAIAKKYDAAFEGSVLRHQQAPAGFHHAYHLYVIESPKRKELFQHLNSKNIFPQVHYIPVHLHPYYRDLGGAEGQFPEAEGYYQHALSLPMYPALTDEQQDFVIETVLNFHR